MTVVLDGLFFSITMGIMFKQKGSKLAQLT